MEQKVPLPQVPLLKTTRKKEFVELVENIEILITQDATKRWLDYLGREVGALTQILVPKVIDNLNDINYIRGVIMGLAMATSWPGKLIKRREDEIVEEKKETKKEDVEKKKRVSLREKQKEREERVKAKLKGGKTDGG